MRTVTVFLSCPGDLLKAKDELSAVVHEVARHFKPFDTYVDFCRHDPQALLGVGEDAQEVVARQMPVYDIYVGMMCGRMGTATRRASSGTIEEFLDARQRFLETGRPEILFYFCDEAPAPADEGNRAQREKVAEFRASFPGLFATFHSIDVLRAKFKDHLLDVLLRQMRGELPPAPRLWLTALASAVDRLGAGHSGYLDSSSSLVDRIVEKVRGLIDLPTTLHAHEIDTLLAAAHLRALARRGISAQAVGSMLHEAPGVGDWLMSAAFEVAALAELPPDEEYREEMRIGEVRCHFVAALLQLGEALDLDHAGIAGARPPVRPADDAPLPCWMAYHTRRIEVRRPGIVTFHLLTGRHGNAEEDRKALSRCAALGFEAEWHRRRRVLASNGVAVSRAPVSVDKSAFIAPLSAGVRERMHAAAEAASSALPRLLHLNEPALRWPTLKALLPLPRSAVFDTLRARWDEGRMCSLQVWAAEGDEPLASVAATRSGEANISATLLPPDGSPCAWKLVEGSGSFSSTLAWGEVRALAPHERIRHEIAASAPDDAAKKRWAFAIGLWNDLVEGLWPSLAENKASREDAQLVHQILLASYDWMREHAPDSGRIDTLRNAAGLVRGAYLVQEGEFA